MIFGFVLRVVNVLPHEQVTWVTTYSGWIPLFTMVPFWAPDGSVPIVAAGSPWIVVRT